VNLDLWLVVAVAAFGLMGLFSGAIKQAAQWLAVATAYLAVKPAATAAGPALAAKLGLPAVGGPVIVVSAAMLLAYVVGSLGFKALLNKLLPAREKTRADRIGGFALGAAKGAMGAFVLLSVVVAFEPQLAQSGIDLDKKTGGSSALAFTRRHNLFDVLHVPILDDVKRLAAARSDPRAAQALFDNPALKGALDDPRLKAALADPALQDALKGANPMAALQNPEIRKLLSNPEVAQALKKIEAPAGEDAPDK
jgi:uncharacterized membrane protein required for colicin V production